MRINGVGYANYANSATIGPNISKQISSNQSNCNGANHANPSFGGCLKGVATFFGAIATIAGVFWGCYKLEKNGQMENNEFTKTNYLSTMPDAATEAHKACAIITGKEGIAVANGLKPGRINESITRQIIAARDYCRNLGSGHYLPDEQYLAQHVNADRDNIRYIYSVAQDIIGVQDFSSNQFSKESMDTFKKLGRYVEKLA